jgi:DNA-binding NarL/FixJ family response regulator
MRQPKISTYKLIGLLADGNTIRSIAKAQGVKLYTLERQIDRLKTKHNCKTATQLVVKLKLSEVNATNEQPNY